MGLPRTGGGLFSLGLTGQRGVLLAGSLGIDCFWGTGDRMVMSEVEGSNWGVDVVDRVLGNVVVVLWLDLVDRAGLTSVWLFLRDLETGAPVELVLADAGVLIEGLEGEGSREARGDGLAELLVDAVVEAEVERFGGGVGLEG